MATSEPSLPSHPIQLESGGKLHKGAYVVAEGIVTVVYDSRRMATPAGEMPSEYVAWLLFRCLIAGMKMNRERPLCAGRPPLPLPTPPSASGSAA
jgi:hypothetical protein